MEEGEGGIGGARTTGGPYRPVFHGPDELFSSELVASNHICHSGKGLRPKISRSYANAIVTTAEIVESLSLSPK
jgi:hypothetical protein